MTISLDDLEGFDEVAEDKDLLSVITERATEASEVKAAMDALKDELNALNARFRHLTEKELPHYMNEAGMKNFTLSDGTKFRVKEFVDGSLERAPDRDFAKQWIVDNDGADLIKTTVSVDFGKGEHNVALSVKAELEEKGLEVQAKESVHAKTYSKFVREKLEEYNEAIKSGENVEPIPFAKLGVFHGTKAEIKGKK